MATTPGPVARAAIDPNCDKSVLQIPINAVTSGLRSVANISRNGEAAVRMNPATSAYPMVVAAGLGTM